MSPMLVFDLDGTLVDSVPDLTAALNRLMAARGLAAFDASATAAMVGDGAAALVERAFAARGAAADAEAVAALVADYTAHATEASRLYPDVAETLAELEYDGWLLAVCTNKPVAAARVVLDGLGLAARFAAIGGGDSFPVRKPDPAHLLATIAAGGGAPATSVMVGDHANDVAASRGAGLPCIFAGWGYGRHGMAAGAAAEASRILEVPAIAGRLLNREQGRGQSPPHGSSPRRPHRTSGSRS